MTVPIHAIFQGGGARLAALLAAAEALQELEATNDVRVASVSGTSAGSFAAAMLATRQPISLFTKRLGPLFEQHYANFCRVTVPRTVRHSAVQLFLPTPLQRAYYIIRGAPLFNEAAFRTFVNDLFHFDTISYRFLSDLALPITITATDLRNQRRLDYTNSSQESLVDALVNSSSIPFAFRTYTESSMIVDGGICANLPTPQFVPAGETDVYPVAFSFPDEPQAQQTTDVISYAKTIISSAMQNSIAEACNRVSKGGGKVIKIDTALTTFDFKGAARYASQDSKDSKEAFARSRARAKDSLLEWLRELRAAKAVQRFRSENEHIVFLNKALYDVFQSQYSPGDVRIIKAAIVVTANCLFPSSDPRSRVPDQVEHIIEICPLHSLRAFSVTTAGVSQGAPGREWSVTNRHLLPSTVICIPLSKPGQDDAPLSGIMALFFSPPLSAEEGPYTLRHVAAQENSMKGLVERGWDFGWHQSGQYPEIETSEIVIKLPYNFPEVELSDLENNIGRVPWESRPDTLAGKAPGVWKQGSKMMPKELLPYNGGGLRCVGWCVRQMKSGDRMGVMLDKR